MDSRRRKNSKSRIPNNKMLIPFPAKINRPISISHKPLNTTRVCMHVIFLIWLKGCHAILTWLHYVLDDQNPNAFISFIPDDDTFTNATTITIVCRGTMTDGDRIYDKEFYYPRDMQIFEGDRNRLKYCPKVEPLVPERECNVNYTLKTFGHFR